MVLFLNEVLYKSLRSQDEDQHLFDFLFNAVELLDRLDSGIANYHLYFLLQLTRFLGFYPDRTFEDRYEYFDLQDAVYVNHPMPHQHMIYPEETTSLKLLLQTSFENLADVKISGIHRKLLLQKILDFYRLHLDNFGEIQSHKILEEIFH